MIELQSFAKINLFLHVLGRRDDGFHELETLFHEIDLCDAITLREAARTEIRCSDPSIPADESNLAWKAWSALASRFDVAPVRIDIDKRIPAGGGLGGGSSNAAAVLRGLVTMFDLPVEERDLATIALEIGSDVPFFLVGGCALASGRGERLMRLRTRLEWPVLLAFPGVPVSTPAAFAKLHETSWSEHMSTPVGVERVETALAAGAAELFRISGNDLEPPAFSLAPPVEAAVRQLADAGADLVRMSGSGSTVFAVFESVRQRDAAAARVDGLAVRPAILRSSAST